jgi:YD repeat-containing protein
MRYFFPLKYCMRGVQICRKEISNASGLMTRFFQGRHMRYLVCTETRYENSSTGATRTEKTAQEYDEWGNPTRVTQADGIEIRRTYYDPSGDESEESSHSESGDVGCPPDPHGFKRYLKTETVLPAPSGYQLAAVLFSDGCSRLPRHSLHGLEHKERRRATRTNLSTLNSRHEA